MMNTTSTYCQYQVDLGMTACSALCFPGWSILPVWKHLGPGSATFTVAQLQLVSFVAHPESGLLGLSCSWSSTTSPCPPDPMRCLWSSGPPRGLAIAIGLQQRVCNPLFSKKNGEQFSLLKRKCWRVQHFKGSSLNFGGTKVWKVWFSLSISNFWDKEALKFVFQTKYFSISIWMGYLSKLLQPFEFCPFLPQLISSLKLHGYLIQQSSETMQRKKSPYSDQNSTVHEGIHSRTTFSVSEIKPCNWV